MSNVIVVEDDTAVRSAVCDALEQDSRFDVIGAAATLDEGAALVEAGGFDVMLLDLDLQGRSGVELIEASSRRWAAKIVVISVLGDEGTVIRAIEAGADGYVLKDSAFTDLPAMVARVLDGESPLSPAVARHLLRRFRGQSEERVLDAESAGLSPREHQVLEELARGFSNKEVAIKYNLSVHTVGDYVKSLYRKLQVTSRGEAISKAVQEGLVRF